MECNCEFSLNTKGLSVRISFWYCPVHDDEIKEEIESIFKKFTGQEGKWIQIPPKPLP